MCNEVAWSENRRSRGSGAVVFRDTGGEHNYILKRLSRLGQVCLVFVLNLLIKQKCVKSICVNCCRVIIRGSRRLPVPPEG